MVLTRTNGNASINRHCEVAALLGNDRRAGDGVRVELAGQDEIRVHIFATHVASEGGRSGLEVKSNTHFGICDWGGQISLGECQGDSGGWLRGIRRSDWR
jgi:hypothetical protein